MKPLHCVIESRGLGSGYGFADEVLAVLDSAFAGAVFFSALAGAAVEDLLSPLDAAPAEESFLAASLYLSLR